MSANNSVPLGPIDSAPQKNGATSQIVSSPEPVGSWLCSEGLYREYIEALSDSNPGLRNADPNNETGGKRLMTKDGAHVVMLEFEDPTAATDRPRFKKTELDLKRLQDKLKGSSRDHGRRRIYIMEGLAKDFVKAFGEHFWMDPTFWLRQERTCVWSNDFTPVSDALPQPSLIDPDSSFHVQYCELREFNKALESLPCFCARTKRHVGMTAPREFKPKPNGAMEDCKDEVPGNTTTAFLRRKVSWWCQKNPTASGWDVIILCDPKLKDITASKDIKERVYNPQTDSFDLRVVKNDELKNEPFQGGYVDFVPPQRLPPGVLPSIKKEDRHPHESMLADLVYYYEQNAHLLTEEEWQSPSNSAIFLKKIVAAHYLQLADYIKAMLPSLELKMQTGWVEEQEQWKALGTISRRCGNYRDDIEDAIFSLGYQLDMPTQQTKDQAKKKPPIEEAWKNCAIDYQYAYLRLKVLKQRADTLMTSMTGLASIAGNKQNLEEAKRVKRLNLLALLFIPLAYTSSLFSMQDEYAPNKPQFWVYWVCAIGVVMFTSVVMWVLDRALNDAAEWTLDSFKSLPKWSKEKGAKSNLFALGK